MGRNCLNRARSSAGLSAIALAKDGAGDAVDAVVDVVVITSIRMQVSTIDNRRLAALDIERWAARFAGS